MPDAFDDFRAEVVALEIERTFWEKATILHAEYHRPPSLPLRDRYARHYADFATLWNHPGGRASAARLDLLDRVREKLLAEGAEKQTDANLLAVILRVGAGRSKKANPDKALRHWPTYFSSSSAESKG